MKKSTIFQIIAVLALATILIVLVVIATKSDTSDNNTNSFKTEMQGRRGEGFGGNNQSTVTVTSTKNSDGTYTCTINKDGKVGKYTVTTAPIVIPVNTPGYSAQHSPSSYSSNELSTYLSNGFIYVYAGCRGRYNQNTEYKSGAPWGVTDLKAAIRYLRYNKDLIPADTEKIFTFGMS